MPNDFFTREAEGLRLLSDHVATPNVIAVKPQGLVLEYLPLRGVSAAFEVDAADALATLHTQKATHFGLDSNNYMGSLPQNNTQKTTGADFYRDCRFLPFIKKATDQGYFTREDGIWIDRFLAKLETLLPDEQPVLLHGDLWSGNIGEAQGRVYFFDPAVHYGYREIDIAMTQLFGGFGDAFYAQYEAHTPLPSGWRERIPLMQLYPLLVHLVLFGGAYRPQVVSAIRAYV